ncbi:MAG: hypothetical protein KUG64_09675 [Cycloclasticus sp.]|nr:hypothetical protein [Cycloclasticus sp.]
MGQIKKHVSFTVTDRTVRRWLNDAANNGDIVYMAVNEQQPIQALKKAQFLNSYKVNRQHFKNKF